MIKRDFLVIFTLALLIRLTSFFFIYSQPARFYSDSDSYNYENIANNLIQHGEFSGELRSPFIPNLYRTPVYPLFIAGVYSLTGNSVFALILMQILISSFTAALMPILVHLINLPPKVGWIAGLILVLDPLISLTTYQTITETVFIGFLIPTIIMLALYFKTKNLVWLIVSAILLGLTSLTRPISQFLPFMLIPLFFIGITKDQWRFVWKSAALFLFISLLVTYTWAYRNYIVANIWTLSAISDQNLLYYRARDVIADVKGISENEASILLKETIQSKVNANHLSPAEEIYLMRSTALEIFRQYPKATLMVHAKGLVRVMINPGFNLVCVMLDSKNLTFDSANNIQGCSANPSEGLVAQTIDELGQMDLLARFTAVWEIILLAGMYLGSIIGMWKLLQKKQWYLLYLLLVLIIYFSVLSAGGESVSRFRIPFIPFLAITAGIGVVNSAAGYQEDQFAQKEIAPKIMVSNP